MSIILDSQDNDTALQLSGAAPIVAEAFPLPESDSEATLALLDRMLVPRIETLPSEIMETFESESLGAALVSALPTAQLLAANTQPTAAVLSPPDPPSPITSTDGASSAWIIALGIPVLLLVLWLALLYFISRRGWRSFAVRYRAPRLPPLGFLADHVSFGSASSLYRGVVRVAFSTEGLYLATTPSFRAFHAPLLIPWACVRSFKHRRHSVTPRYRIEIEDRAGRISIRLPGKPGTQLRTVLPHELVLTVSELGGDGDSFVAN